MTEYDKGWKQCIKDLDDETESLEQYEARSESFREGYAACLESMGYDVYEDDVGND